MHGNGIRSIFICLAITLCSMPALARDRGVTVGIRGGPHDLTQQGAQAGAPGDSCAFCHTPHFAGGEGPLWNIVTPDLAYRTYESQRGELAAGQPDGSSKLCLSCHDGQVAPTLRRVANDAAAGASMRPPTGQALGPDLSNDHPVSVVYGAGVSATRAGLVPAATAPSGLGGSIAADLLDRNGKLQCTSCHDAHSNGLGKFLVITAKDDILCRTCHNMREFPLSAHAPGKVFGQSLGCATCHTSHNAAPGTALLRDREPLTCGPCHKAQFTAMATAVSRHGSSSPLGRTETRRMTCSTCHDPHVVRAAVAYDRRILTDPRDTTVVPNLINSDDTPYNVMVLPEPAAQSSPTYCLLCHDGSWPGATNILAEVRNPGIRASEFALKATNLHFSHTSWMKGDKIGCSYCHDAHGSQGPLGVRRGALLYPWLNIREFPYQSRRSCSSSDPANKCH